MCGCGTCRKTSILKCWSPHTPPVSVVCILSLVYERREKCCNRGNLGHEMHQGRDDRRSDRSNHRIASTPSRTATMSEPKRPDPILLTLFANRFMSVAEAMGRSLQQTSISTNIKERLDFSCALFGPDGDLVANAPFIPIHLGAMSL